MSQFSGILLSGSKIKGEEQGAVVDREISLLAARYLGCLQYPMSLVVAMQRTYADRSYAMFDAPSGDGAALYDMVRPFWNGDRPAWPFLRHHTLLLHDDSPPIDTLTDTLENGRHEEAAEVDEHAADEPLTTTVVPTSLSSVAST